MEDATDPIPQPGPLPRKVSRLSSPQKRLLKARISNLGATGTSVTLPQVLSLAAQALSLDITRDFAVKLLTEFGYHIGSGLEPVLSGAGKLEHVRVWELKPVARPLTQAERAQALIDRIKLVTDAYLDDLMEDPLLKFAELDEIATETTRCFALSMTERVRARARIGADRILPACADTASLVFKGSAGF